jgi:integrase
MRAENAKLAEAARRLADGGTGAQPADDARAFGALLRWLPDDAVPITDAVLVEYLASHSHWSAGMVRGTAWAINRHLRRIGSPPAVGMLTRRYVSRQKLLLGARSLPPTRPLRISTAAEIADQLEEHSASKDPWIGALREGLVVVRRFADPAQTIWSAWRLLNHLSLRRAGNQLYLYLAGSDIRTVTADHETWEETVSLLTNPSRRTSRVQGALKRAGIHPLTTVADITDDMWEWHWLMLDPRMPRIIRNRAYLLLGVNHARRHAELARADITDVATSDAGYVINYFDHKNGRRLTYEIAHVSTDVDACPGHCPACAMGDLLRLHAAAGRTAGPLLPTRYAGEDRRMTRQNGRYIVRQLTSVIGAPTGSTRSLRVGGATSAWEAGWSLNKIAAHLGQLDPNTTALYIRRHEGQLRTIQLDLDAVP